MVSQVFYYNQAQQYPQIQKDYQDVKQRVDKSEKSDNGIMLALEALPPIRRVSSLGEKFDNGDTLPALGLASLALINLPEDMRDIKAAGGQLDALFSNKKFQGGYDYKNYQHDFSFFRGTLLEPMVDLKKTKNTARANKLLDLDRPLLDTKFGRKIKDLLKVKEFDISEVKTFNKEQGIWETARDINGKKRYALAFEGSAFGKLTARAMNRTTLIGTAVLAAIELPKIFKAMNQGDSVGEQVGNTVKQTVNSSVNLASITAGIAYGGAIGSKHGGPLGSLVGMGAGAILGGFASKKVQGVIS